MNKKMDFEKIFRRSIYYSASVFLLMFIALVASLLMIYISCYSLIFMTFNGFFAALFIGLCLYWCLAPKIDRLFVKKIGWYRAIYYPLFYFCVYVYIGRLYKIFVFYIKDKDPNFIFSEFGAVLSAVFRVIWIVPTFLIAMRLIIFVFKMIFRIIRNKYKKSVLREKLHSIKIFDKIKGISNKGTVIERKLPAEKNKPQ